MIHEWVVQFSDFPGGSEVKVSAWNPGDPGSIPGSGRSPGEGNGNPHHYSCLKNPMDSMKRQKDMTPGDKPPKLEGIQYATEEDQRAITNNSRKNEAIR